ncbi:MAG: DUF5317 domain-containing protein [Solirubrobacteraceae bacterium]
MILLAGALICLASVPLRGGRLSRLGQIDLRYGWVALVALGLQLLIISVAPGGSKAAHAGIYLGSYALAAVFLWGNRGLTGMRLLAAGALSNALVIVVNGGVMPAAAAAQRLAGLKTGSGFQNSAHLAHPHLLWLGDVIPVPGPWPLGNVLSIGDLVIFAGLWVLLHAACGGREPGVAPV